MDTAVSTAIVAFFSFLGAGFGAVLLNRRYDKDRKEQRRKERADIILHAIQALVQLLTQYEEFVQMDTGAFVGHEVRQRGDHAKIVGQAIGEILVVNDLVLSEIAINRLTPNMVEQQDDPSGFAQYGDYRNRNRNAMIDALKRLGILMEDTIDFQKPKP